MNALQWYSDGKEHEVHIEDSNMLGTYVSYLLGRYGNVKVTSNSDYQYVFDVQL